MNTIKVAHTLHGYDRGHRLLARAGEIRDDELESLDRLSDLSGYLPSGEAFSVYHTGFPCGRYYALAATWLDTSAKRAGTVLTHTVLFPLAAAAQCTDLHVLAALHRRPSGASDAAAYRELLAWETVTTVPILSPLDTGAHRALITLWFAQQQRPVLWVSPVPTLDVVAHLWSLLGADERGQLAFCTYALQARRISGKIFGFLHLPAAARAGFHELAGSVAWCEDGKLVHPSALQLSQDSFVDRMARDPVALLGELRDWCRRHDLTMPPAPDVPAAYRVLELEVPAKQRLAAARSRADLIARLWPRVAWNHHVRMDAVDALHARLPDAPMAPRPLWELRDFLDRAEVQARGAVDAEFARRVASLTVAELSRRLLANFEQSLPDAIHLVLEPPSLVCGSPVLPTLRSAVRSKVPRGAPAQVSFAARLLAVAVRRRHRALAELALEDLMPSERRRVALDVLGEFTEDQVAEARGFLLAVAAERHDTVLVFAVASVDRVPMEALQLAERAAGETADDRTRALEPLIEQVPASLWVEWAARIADIRVGMWAATHIPSSPSLTLEDVGLLCQEGAFGARIFAEYARGRPSDEIRRTLASHPSLAQAVVVYAFEHAAMASFAEIALEARPAREYLIPSVLASLAHANYFAVQSVVDRLGRAWLDAVKDSTLDAGGAGEWLTAEALRAWVEQRLSPWHGSDFAIMRLAEQIDLAVVLALTRRTVSGLRVAGDWCYALLLPALRKASTETLVAMADELCSLIIGPWQGNALPAFASEILERMRSLYHIPSVPSLVIDTFRAMYPDLVAGRDHYFRHTSWWYSAFRGWDRAKSWRNWLLDTWIKQRWPPHMLAEAVEIAPGLLGQLRDRALETKDGRYFWDMVEASRATRTRH